MKPSEYNIFYQNDGDMIVFNTFTTGSILLSGEIANLLQEKRIDQISSKHPQVFKMCSSSEK